VTLTQVSCVLAPGLMTIAKFLIRVGLSDWKKHFLSVLLTDLL